MLIFSTYNVCIMLFIMHRASLLRDGVFTNCRWGRGCFSQPTHCITYVSDRYLRHLPIKTFPAWGAWSFGPSSIQRTSFCALAHWFLHIFQDVFILIGRRFESYHHHKSRPLPICPTSLNMLSPSI